MSSCKSALNRSIADGPDKAGSGKCITQLLSRRRRLCKWLFDQGVDTCVGKCEPDLEVVPGGRGDDRCIDPEVNQIARGLEDLGTSSDRVHVTRRIGDTDQLDARQLVDHARVVSSHHAEADHADTGSTCSFIR